MVQKYLQKRPHNCNLKTVYFQDRVRGAIIIVMIIAGLAFFVFGILFVLFAQNIWNFTGNIEFIENYLPGDTKFFIQLCGVIMVLLGIMFITGVGETITGPLGDSLSSLFGGFK